MTHVNFLVTVYRQPKPDSKGLRWFAASNQHELSPMGADTPWEALRNLAADMETLATKGANRPPKP